MSANEPRPGRVTPVLPVARAIAVLLALLGSVAVSSVAYGQAGTGLRGRISDKRTGKPLGGAPVLIQSGGRTENTVTDANGIYRIAVPPGTYTVRSYFDMYHGVRVSGVTVTQGEMVEVSLGLPRIDESRDVSVQELEIPYRADTTTAAAQDQLRQASSGIGEGLGAKQMSQTGASDAGSAAARVVGVTIESSQLIIRGLGGRYTRVLLNGIPVPSVDPDVPGADLDLFPTGVIDSLNISKAFLPDLPADFAGGVMEIKSISFPRELTLELGLSTGFDTQSTFRNRLDYRGGRHDKTGFDDGRRSLPDSFPTDRPVGNYPPEERYAAAESLRNVWQYRYKPAWPKLGFDLTAGNSRKFGRQKRFGYLVTAGYEYDSVRKVGVNRPNPNLTATGLEEKNNFRAETGVDEVQLSGLGTASLDLGIDHSMTVLTLFNRTVSDQTALQSGKAGDFTRLDKWQLHFLARQLWFNQLFGDHRNLGGTRLRLRWAVFHAIGVRSEPDRRAVSYAESGGVLEWRDTGSGERFFSDLRQDDLGSSLSLRFPLWAQAWGTLGGFSQLSWRSFDIRRLRLRKHQANTEDVFTRPPEELLSAEGIGKWMDITEEPQPYDSYSANQSLYAGYLMLETPVVGRLSLTGGVRTEVMSQEVESRSPFAMQTAAPKRTDRRDIDYLPGAALKYQLNERMLARAAYGMTVSRPQIRELAPYTYYDFLRDRGVSGNPDLKRTLIHNADLRWEWFFGEGEIAAVSAFYKRFKDPIELAVLDNTTGGSQFRNVTRAQNLGSEFETRLSLGRLARALRKLNLDANLALVRSRLDLPPDLARIVRASRPLAGQSPYVANLSLRFFDEHRGVTASVVYNVVGPRIVDAATVVRVGVQDVIPPDIEEQAFHSLDLVGSAGIGKHVKVKVRIRNLLLQGRELKQGDFLLQRLDPGISGSLGLAISY
jgi:hypothetical protein